MRLGKINFTDLNLLLWDSVLHFLPFSDYIKDYHKTIYESVHAVGIISGCELVPVSGLTVRVQEGVVLFSNGELCKVEEQDIALSAADPTNPRIDRLELTFTFENNSTVTKTDDSVVTFDQLATATLGALTGTPAGSPAIPVKTAGAVSVGSVTVPATATVVGASDISTADDVAEYSGSVNVGQRTFSVPQSTSGAEDISGLLADKNQFKQVWYDYQITRNTDTDDGKVVSGTLSCMLNPDSGDWIFTDDMKGQTEEIGVVLSGDPSSGQIQWDVDNTDFGGANHIGVFTVNRRTLDV